MGIFWEGLSMSKNINILRLPQVLQRIGVSRSTLYQLIKDGKFNAPINLGERAVGWTDEDVADFIASRIKASRPEVNKGRP